MEISKVQLNEIYNSHMKLREQLNKEASYHMARSRILREQIENLDSSMFARFRLKEREQLNTELKLHDQLAEANLTLCGNASKLHLTVGSLLKVAIA